MLKFFIFLVIMVIGQGPVHGREAPERRVQPERLELIRLWWLVEELQVDEEQATRLFPVWSQHHRDRKALQQRRREAGRELVALLREDAKEETLKKQIEVLVVLDQEKADLARKFHQSMTELLTVRQQARFLLFEERFRKDLKDLLEEFRQPPAWSGYCFRRRRGGESGRGDPDRGDSRR
jgi:hypothetical protein